MLFWPGGSRRGEEVCFLRCLSALVPRDLAFGVTLVSQQLQHLHGLELAFLLTLGLSLSLELCSKEEGPSRAGWSSGQHH